MKTERGNDYYYNVEKEETKKTIKVNGLVLYLKAIKAIIEDIDYLIENCKEEDELEYYKAMIENKLSLIDLDMARQNTKYLATFVRQSLNNSNIYFLKIQNLKIFQKSVERINEIMDKHIAYRDQLRVEELN